MTRCRPVNSFFTFCFPSTCYKNKFIMLWLEITKIASTLISGPRIKQGDILATIIIANLALTMYIRSIKTTSTEKLDILSASITFHYLVFSSYQHFAWRSWEFLIELHWIVSLTMVVAELGSWIQIHWHKYVYVHTYNVKHYNIYMVFIKSFV